jgi:two-component system chemotaxis sensor kinase CheA
MSDPLVHVIRNAVDHGIENQSDRESAGKPPIATIHLEAFSDPSGVTICVKDDGRGLNERKILEKARERGLVGEAEEPSRSEIQRMIFMAGFSTADAVSDISGRGVGMDVVLRAIESLRGEIGIESEQGVGTAFRITLPTSLSIVDALVVRVAQTRYAVPVHDLTEIIDLGSYIVERTGEGNSTLSLRGSAVPVYELRNFVDRHDEDAHGSTGSDPALVIRLGDASVAFVIDEVVTQQQVVVRPLSDKLKGIPGVSGCTILGDGEPGMILSLQEIARQCLTH